MTPKIDKIRTGKRIQLLMKKQGITVKDICSTLSLGSVQSVYHWLSGITIPTTDNLYALSSMLHVPMDMLVCGNRKFDSRQNSSHNEKRLLWYYTEVDSLLAV